MNLATVFVTLTSQGIPLLCSLIKGCEYCECLYFYNYYPYRIVSKITISSAFVSIRIVSCDDRIVSSLVYCRCHHQLVQFTCTHVFCKDTWWQTTTFFFGSVLLNAYIHQIVYVGKRLAYFYLLQHIFI